MEIVFLLVGLFLGSIFIYLVLRPKISNLKEINRQIEKQNRFLAVRRDELNEQISQLDTSILYRNNELNDILIKVSALKTKEEEISERAAKLQERIDTDLELIYEKSFQIMQEKLNQSAQQLSQEYQDHEELCKKEYLETIDSCSRDFSALLASKQTELEQISQVLETMRAKAKAAIEAAKREEEKKLELDKYKILISELDLLEINRLREIAPYFRNPRAIYKIIWETYYRNNTTDLINRIIGSEEKTGIYKITNLNNQKTYIGQATNLAERIRQHIKCGIGIDTPNNKLYNAMMKYGVENYSFEVIEECSREELNKREAFWIEFYHSQDFGYNMTKGNTRN